MSKTVIAWDESTYTDRLRDEVGEDVRIVTAEGDLYAALKGGGQGWKDVRLVVLLELAWEGQRSRFHGFELVKELLLEDFDGPIVLCSYLEKKQFYSAQGIGRFLAQMPFPFVRLPVAPKALEEEAQGAEAFSPMLRAYVRENYLAQEPFGRIAHDLRQALRKNDLDMKRTLRRLLEDLDALNVNLPTDIAQQRRAVERGLRQDEWSDEARASIEELSSHLEQHSTSQATETEGRPAPAKSDYAVMLVEDDEVQREKYRSGLEPYFEVFAVGSAAEALDELRTSGQKYLAIVADWVLLEEDEVTWQPIQGFDLLVKAWNESAPICLIALTSLNREAVASVLRSTSLDIDWFSKSEVGENARWPYYAFAGYIRKRVRSLLPDLVNMPESTWWTEKGLGDLFMELKYESGRWEQVRQQTEETTLHIVREFVEEESAASPINKGDYKLKTPGRTTTPTMSHLEMILPQRLAVLALHFEHRLDPLEIRRLLRKEEDEKESKVKNRAKQWYAKLGLAREDGRIPESSVLGHERDWLRRTYGLDLKEVELEEQAKAGGTTHRSLASEINTLCADVESIQWTLAREGAGAPEQDGEIETVAQAVQTLRDFARWAESKSPRLKRRLRRELEEILNHPDYKKIWDRFDYAEDVEALIDSLRR